MTDTLPFDVVEPMVVEEVVEVTDDEKILIVEELSDDRRLAAWQGRRPSIDHLEAGVVTTEDPNGDTIVVPLFDVGDRIVVDVRTEHLKNSPWLYTLVGKVRSIDDDTGLVTIFDEDTDPRNPAVRYVSMRLPTLQAFKIAPLKGNPFDSTKKHVRPTVTPVTGPDGSPERRGRGRPKGTKNRPKDVIVAEKAARKAAKK